MLDNDRMRINHLFAVITLIALVFLGVIAGAAMMYFEVGAYQLLRNPFIAAEALLGAEARSDDIDMGFTGAKPVSPFDASLAPVRDKLVGVTRYDSATAYEGFTLYSTKEDAPIINLVNMRGERVHQWRISAEKLRASGMELGRLTDRQLNVIAHVFPNGDVSAVLTAKGNTPWGVGLVKLDKDSNMLWAFAEPVHHDHDIGPDGKIYTLGHFVQFESKEGLEKIEVPFLDDTVVVLSESGEKLQEFSILDAIRDSEFQSVLRYANPVSYNGDLLHANAIQYLTKEQLTGLPKVPPGALLISLRNLDTLIMVNPETEKVVWAVRGGWHLQHDPDMLPNGDIMLFDNQGDLSANAKGSRVIQFDPVTMEQTWVFPEGESEQLYSAVKSSQQRLSNGNTLITESNNGRILEVTPNKVVVWEFYIPERKTSKTKVDEVFSKVVDAQRFASEFFSFEFNHH
ncbi:MAG: hypothetical protein GY779_11530 [Gammaproteobacteria bacterium]|nr:hypothetical protein [Gammaproteobacteria bacterium]